LFVKNGIPALIADFLLNVVALLLATTVYSSIPVPFNILLLTTAVLAYVLPPMTSQPKKQLNTIRGKASDEDPTGRDLDPLPIRPFITAYRGTMMIVTCLAILAVDFKVFPRRFAKVETWGTSLMDMGVGSFVFSAGLVSARPVLKARLTSKSSSLVSMMRASLRSSLPLLVLGFVRLYSVKGLDYAEHVTEYGVHWNFFFTLALLPPFIALCHPLPDTFRCYVLPSLLGFVYEFALDQTDLKAYILTAPRVDLLSQNREGVFSFCGYLVIFLAGQALGFDILPRKPDSANDSSTPWSKRAHIVKRLIYWCLSWGAQYYLSAHYSRGSIFGLGLQPSRRLANLPYVEWVVWFNCGQLLVFCVTETLLFPGVYWARDKITEKRRTTKATSRVINAYNRNGLAIFLLANLLTGLVNMTVDTISMDQWGSIAILFGYASLLTAIAVALDSWNISIKM